MSRGLLSEEERRFFIFLSLSFYLFSLALRSEAIYLKGRKLNNVAIKIINLSKFTGVWIASA